MLQEVLINGEALSFNGMSQPRYFKFCIDKYSNAIVGYRIITDEDLEKRENER